MIFSNQKTKELQLRLSNDKYDFIKSESKRLGISMNAFIQLKIFNQLKTTNGEWNNGSMEKSN